MDAKQEVQRRHYEKIAHEYDVRYQRENSNHLYKIAEIGQTLFKHLAPRTDGYDILEVGGGTGIHAHHFLKAHREQIRSFTLSDLSREMLDQARFRLKEFDVRYLVSPAEKMATTETFDGIYLSGAMHHFADPRRAIGELKSRLKPGGVLVICEPIVWNPLNFVKAVLSPVDWGQFQTTRRNISRALAATGYRLVTNRVLHWRGPSDTARRLWPYRRLERLKALDPLAVMFLLGAKI